MCSINILKPLSLFAEPYLQVEKLRSLSSLCGRLCLHRLCFLLYACWQQYDCSVCHIEHPFTLNGDHRGGAARSVSSSPGAKTSSSGSLPSRVGLHNRAKSRP